MKTETCQYLIADGYSHTQCGQVEFADVTKDYKYCPDCGRKVKGVKQHGYKK